MLSRQYAKLCDLPDFADPELGRLVGEIVPGASAERPHRKQWEFALAALFLRDVGLLDGRAEILDVGAGNAPVLSWLAARAGRLVAVDVYGEGGFADQGVPQASERLEVRAMDARALELEDESFDAVVSFSSIEHFGGSRDIDRAAAEVGRVLRPGGYAFLVTELLVRRSPLAAPVTQFLVRLATAGRLCHGATPRRRVLCQAFTPRTLRRDVIAPSGLRLMQPLDLGRSAAAMENPQRLRRNGRVTARAPYPHVTVTTLGAAFTSVALPLQKPS